MSVRTNLKKVNLIAAMLAGALSVNALSILPAVARAGDASRARQESIHAQMMQLYRFQSESATPANAQNLWQNVSSAPQNFPIPVFSGTETTFMMPKMPQGIPGIQNVSQMVLRTKDSPTNVNQWYRNSLSRVGLTIDASAPQITTVGYRTMKAESDKMSCSILIYGRESGEYDTTINITAVRKQASH